ncbi:BTAD domain-containing putative transcriptional regulator [Kineosporia babensis]|uniref:Winged helix-turn-helix domain-containing protein n=1 Tax=Kineosporia babensis TaxID=499548 RepID=A0A9X1NBG6_9ACTN|nr:winged helix-turn-helix domain-containing protein [Kineosporia babensis]
MVICRVLGPLEVVAGGIQVQVGGPQPRRLLQTLVMARGEPVSEDRLAEAVWPDEPPANPSASLRAYISRLRRTLGTETLTHGPGGYALEADSDVLQFEALLARAGKAIRPSEALPAFRQALELWRGSPYPDLPALAEPARQDLEQRHATAIEDQAAALLAAGDAPTAVHQLRAAVHDDPYRERRWELLILGLYRSARQSEALAALREVRALLADDLGVDPGPELQNLERRLLAQDPALLLSATARTTAPQRPLTRFVGREREMGLLSEGMARSRLMTLVGPGGSGKTRLAVEWAPQAPLARLADVRSPLDLPSAIALALGMTETPAEFTGLSGLLVLDNCEHLTDAVADLTVALLAGSPELRILVTSREGLGIDGEHLLPVDPLPAPDSVALLVDRIAAVRPGWRPDPVEANDVARLAEALDGVPLALELAAARARVMGLGEIVELLGSRFPELGRIPRNALTPHRTLEATVAWSVDLLSEPERAMLLRLWPFEGGFSLEAAAAVGCDLTGLSSLVARSIVSADTGMVPTRYRLLEIMRAYCREHDPDAAGSALLHAVWSRELVARTVDDLRGPRSARAIRVLNRELPNLRAGLAHDLAAAPADALHTAALLEWFWLRADHITEGLRLLDQALAGAPEAPNLDRARALSAHGTLSWLSGDLLQSKQLVGRAIEVLGAAHADEEQRLLGQLRYYEGLLHIFAGDYRAAETSARASVTLARATDHTWFGTLPQLVLGAALDGQGRTHEGRTILLEANRRAQEHGYGWAGAFGNMLLARSLLADDAGAALDPLGEALRLFERENDPSLMLSCLVYGALALLRRDRPLDGATLHAAAFRHAARRGIRLSKADPIIVEALETAVAELDSTVAASATTAAAELSEEAAIGLLSQVAQAQ